ncbi:ABC transporter ATP-binding protein [Oerskovia turbata]
MIALQVQGLSATLGGRLVLDSVDVQVERGESVAIVGPSGTGKTTLLNCVLGTVQPQSGRVLVAGHDVTGLSRSRLARLRAEHLGVVFQHGELLGELTPVENVALPALIVGRPREHAVARATELLESFGVPTDREATDHLSGGERQRTALARALVNEPSLVLADEPTGSLDPAIRDRVADILFDTPARRGCGLLVVTHDPLISARADRVVHLERVLAVDEVHA